MMQAGLYSTPAWQVYCQPAWLLVNFSVVTVLFGTFLALKTHKQDCTLNCLYISSFCARPML